MKGIYTYVEKNKIIERVTRNNNEVVDLYDNKNKFVDSSDDKELHKYIFGVEILKPIFYNQKELALLIYAKKLTLNPGKINQKDFQELKKVGLNDGEILEANQIQTAASAGESLAAGIIFTMPALILIGVWKSFDMYLTTVIAFTGGLLGILFMIPMRQVFIVKNEDNLQYPEGLACASVLEALTGGSPSRSRVARLGEAICGWFVGTLCILGTQMLTA